MIFSLSKRARPGLSFALPLLAVASLVGIPEAQQTITKAISYSLQLTDAFAEADANPANTYILNLDWRRDSNGNTITWEPAITVKLTKGHVQVIGSRNNQNPQGYIFDGKGNKTVFAVIAATGYKPTLTLSGITVQNGYSSNAGGGGLDVYFADDIQIYYCRFLNNKSSLNGSGIRLQGTRNFYMMKSLVEGNVNTQIGGCGGGQTSGGGGIAYIAGTQTGYFSLHNSTISKNKACRGGGIQVNGNVTLNMHNNTFSGNEADRKGGGILLQANSKPSYFYHNTIANNKAGVSNSIIDQEVNAGGGVVFEGYTGTGHWDGNVFATNTVAFPTPTITYRTEDCYRISGTPGFSKYTNVVGRIGNCSVLGTGGTWGVGTDNSPFDPKLASLSTGTTNDGFALPNHLPQSDSPLRGNYFNPTSGYHCPSTDERGWPRKSNGCDIGAIERGPNNNP